MPRPPAVEALLDLLPEAGAPFHQAERAMWTRAFASILDIAYGAPAPVEQAAPPAITAPEPAAAPAKRAPGRPAGVLPGNAKRHADGSVTCPLCGKRPSSADAYRQHWRRNHETGDIAHVSGPPPRPAPSFAPPPPPEPEQPAQPPVSMFEERARQRAIEAAFEAV